MTPEQEIALRIIDHLLARLQIETGVYSRQMLSVEIAALMVDRIDDVARERAAEWRRAAEQLAGPVRAFMDYTNNICPLCGRRIAGIGDRHADGCALGKVSE